MSEVQFLVCCIECRHVLGMKIMYVCPSVYLFVYRVVLLSLWFVCVCLCVCLCILSWYIQISLLFVCVCMSEVQFLPCCIECRHILVMRILSVRSSVSLSVMVEFSLWFVHVSVCTVMI